MGQREANSVARSPARRRSVNPLGNSPPNGIKFFAAAEVLEFPEKLKAEMHADIATLRREYPKLATLEQVLRHEDWTSERKQAA